MLHYFSLTRIDVEALLERVLGGVVAVGTFQHPADLMQGRDFVPNHFAGDRGQIVD